MAFPLAIWMDGAEAKVFHIRAETVDESVIQSPARHIHRHPKDHKTRIHNHPDDQHAFFRDVAASLDGEGPILIVGPSVTKLLFFRYLLKNNPAVEARVVGLETVDHPTDRQIIAHVRDYFRRPSAAPGSDDRA